MEGGFRNWVIESDATNVINVIRSLALRTPKASLIEDVCDALRHANSGSVYYAP